jgi:hypothetical protein
MDNWLVNYYQAVLEISRLLGMRFIWGENGYTSIGARTALGDVIQAAITYQNDGNITERNVEISKLCMLVNHLQNVQKHSPTSFQKFKKILIDTHKNLNQYFGVRMEINIANSLIKKNIKFVNGEAPDYYIPGFDVFIECTSVHMTKDSTKNAIEKISEAIKKKSQKPYCNNSCILCIDITNVVAFIGTEEAQIVNDKSKLREVIKLHLKENNSKFGCILLFRYYMDENSNFMSHYVRIDNENIIPSLFVFLEENYPFGDVYSGPGWQPFAG